jgi:hypothetical protein
MNSNLNQLTLWSQNRSVWTVMHYELKAWVQFPVQWGLTLHLDFVLWCLNNRAQGQLYLDKVVVCSVLGT